MIDVVIIGGGAVATALAREIETAPNLRLVQVWTRNKLRITNYELRAGNIESHCDCQPAAKNHTLYNSVSEETLAPPKGGEAAQKSYAETLNSAHLYIIAVTDNAIGEVSRRFEFPADSVVAHTAGSVGVDTLSARIEHRAVLYPLQSFTRGRTVHDFRSRVPFLVEGATAHALQTVRAVAAELSDRVVEMDSPARARMHLAAVFASNFANAMWVAAAAIADNYEQAERIAARELCRGGDVMGEANYELRPDAAEREQSRLRAMPSREEGDQRSITNYEQVGEQGTPSAGGVRGHVCECQPTAWGGGVLSAKAQANATQNYRKGGNFDLLKPLISEIAAKALEMPSPRDAQTGPAARGDVETQARHIEMLASAGSEIAQNHPELAEIYKKISNFIWKTSRKN